MVIVEWLSTVQWSMFIYGVSMFVAGGLVMFGSMTAGRSGIGKWYKNKLKAEIEAEWTDDHEH